VHTQAPLAHVPGLPPAEQETPSLAFLVVQTLPDPQTPTEQPWVSALQSPSFAHAPHIPSPMHLLPLAHAVCTYV
jgi:hypothetical protein